ncbi:unnamed protein product [Camellia sinensis]
MAESAVSFVIQYLAPLLADEVKLLKGVRKEIFYFIDELERMQSVLKDADSIAEAGDEVTRWITVLKQQHKIASQIKDIKVRIREIVESDVRYRLTTFLEHNNHSSSITRKLWHKPQVGYLYIEDDEIVGIESPKYELIGRLLEKKDQSQAVISVVGMRGIGKTTLAKNVYNSQEVAAHFDCKAWVSISQSYKLEELLKTMIEQLSRNNLLPLPDEGTDSLIAKLRGYLYEKKYVIVFDDVWQIGFWGSIRHALPQNSKGSRVIITTCNEQVAAFCKGSSIALQSLSKEKAWQLFCKNAFQRGLPLAIVAIGGLLSTKNKVLSEWQKFYDTMGIELERNLELEGNPCLTIVKLLLLSYQDLPHRLKSCLLYFDIIPEKYPMTRGRLIRLWIAERFVEEKQGTTLEEVAEAYLNEPTQRRLLRVSESKLYGRVVIEYQVHDALKYCRLNLRLHKRIQVLMTQFVGCLCICIITVRKRLWKALVNPQFMPFFLFEVGKLPKRPLLCTLAANFKLLNVLDLEGAPLDQLHEEVGNLYFLGNLSVRRTGVQIIPKSIGNLHNLLTIDLKYSPVSELPIDIDRLHKLQHLLAYYRNYGCENIVDIVRGVRIQGEIGHLQELQKSWHVETNHDDGLSLIEELGNWLQLRKLGITKLRREHGSALCATIEKMNYLKYLKVKALSDDEILDLQKISSLPQYLQRLNLGGRLGELPDWIPKLQNLVNYLYCTQGLKSIIIKEGALPLLKELRIGSIPQLKKVPSGIHDLQKLKTPAFIDMPKKFLDRMQPQPNQTKAKTIGLLSIYLMSCSGLGGGFSGYWNSGTLQKYFERKCQLPATHTVEAKSMAEAPEFKGELMAERVVISVIQYLGPLLASEVELLRGVRKEMVSIKAELERIHSFLKDAESRAETGDEGVKIWVKQVRQVAYRIQDVVDEHILFVLPKQPGLFGSLHKVIRKITKLKPRHEIASQIQDNGTTIREIKEGADRYGFSTSSLSEHSSTRKDNMWRDPRLASLFIGDDEVVGIESPKYELISRLVDQNQSERAVISVVGMVGIGKTTLAKKVYDSQEVVAHFTCKAWITVSQSYKPEELLKTMIKELSGIYVLPDEGIESLIVKLRGYLSEKRYVIVFDDVWETDFWGSIRNALPKNSEGSRVIVTTRKDQVAAFCTETSVDHVHELQALSQETAWKLFCTKAFQLDFGGHCPPDLEEVSQAIVRKCQGLPLAIAAIGGLLSTKNKGISEWQKFYGSMNSELERNPDLKSISKILLFSYNDLPHDLKSCFLYFGIMPEDYSIKAGRLIRLWIVEGFVEEQNGKTLEEVAEEYLTELIHRRLVLVSTTKFDGRVGRCQVHDVVREIILSKSKEFSLCQIVERENSSFNATTRRLSMHMRYCNMDKVMKSISKSPVHSVLLFQEGELPKKPLLGTLAANFKLLKVLDLEDAHLDQLHEEVGNLFILRYLSIRSTQVEIIPKSIGKLQSLQTLDLKHCRIRELPFDISRLHKLRHLIAYSRNYEPEYLNDIIGVKIQGGIGGLEELQSLWYVETNDVLIKELEKLRQLRKLGITKLEREHGRALCAAIEKMTYLERLSVWTSSDDEILDLQYISSPPLYVQFLYLTGRLEKLPEFDQERSSKSPSSLSLWDAYDGEQLYFEVGRFQKLKELSLVGLKGLNSVIIEEGALPLLEKLTIEPSPQLKEVPSGIHHLRNLKILGFVGMPEEFINRMELKPNQGKDYLIVKHIPRVELWCRIGKQVSITYISTLQQYFNRKVVNARIREYENESQS